MKKPPGDLLDDIAGSFEQLGFYWVGDRRGDIIDVGKVEVIKLYDAAVLGVDADQVFVGVRAAVKFAAEVSLESSLEWVENYPRQRGSKRDDILNRQADIDVDLQMTVNREGQVQYWKVTQVNNGKEVEVS